MSGIVSFFKLFKLALAGRHVDATSGSIDRAIFLLAVPMIFEMFMESLFAVVDVFFVNRVGIEAVAVVGLTESVLTIVYSLGIGLSMGATALVARRIGEKNPKAASVAGAQAIYLAFSVSIFISFAGFFYSPDILRAIGASEYLVSYGSDYMQIMLSGNFVIILLFLINGIFRGAGDATIAMRSLWLANGVNIVLDPLLIMGYGPFPELGVTGAAVATTTGRSIGVLYQLYYLFNGKSVIKLTRECWNISGNIIKKLIQVSAGGTGQFVIASASWIFLMRIMSQFGSESLAGYTTAIRIIIFTILPAWGFSNAAATMVGQNLGANLPDRAERAVWRTGFLNMLFMGFDFKSRFLRKVIL
jgi:putative MATE family efflux protein